MRTPPMEISLPAVEHNTREIVERLRPQGVHVVGVTKGVGAHPEIAHAMLRGGAAGLADSRIANLKRLRRAGIETSLALIRGPLFCELDETVDAADVSYNTEMKVLEALSATAVRLGRRHGVILMLELGDRREGISPEDAPEFARRVADLSGLYLTGIAGNLGCYGAVIPEPEHLGLLTTTARAIEDITGQRLSVLSGGSSTALPVAFDGRLPPGINQLRIGDTILLGRSAVDGRPLDGFKHDGFDLVAEVIEVKEKPSLPLGESGTDAMGHEPVFRDRGVRRRALVAVGEQDTRAEGLSPMRPGVKILGASSDHLVLDVEKAEPPVHVGDQLAFGVDYPALMTAMTSPYVTKLTTRDA